MAMSSDGNLLAISSIDPKCNGYSAVYCATGKVQLFTYNPMPLNQKFEEPIPNPSQSQNGNTLVERERDRDRSIFGSKLSLGGDGSSLFIAGTYVDLKHNNGSGRYDGFAVRMYDVDKLFYWKCHVPYPSMINQGQCQDYLPYNTPECGYDGGDCNGP